MLSCNSGGIPGYGNPGIEEILLISLMANSSPTSEQKLRGIWIAGGYNGSSVVNRTDLFDPQTNRYFSDAAPGLNVPRSFLTMVSAGSRIYAIGGVTSAGAVSNVVESLDVTAAVPSWQLASSLNTARVNPDAVYLGGKLYVMGGSTSTAPTLTGSIEEMTGSVWSAAAYLAILAVDQKLDGGICEVNGVVYLSAGRNATVARSTVNNGWIQGGSNATTALMTGVVEPAMSAVAGNDNEQRWGISSAAISNLSLPATVFIVGGHVANPTTNAYPVASSVFTSATRYVSTFRTGNVAFSTKYDMLYTRVFPRAVSVTAGSYPGIYIIGGANSAGNITPIEYLPVTGGSIGVFTERAAMLTPRYAFGATTVNQ